jgi:DNA-binding NtrC family response regulator
LPCEQRKVTPPEDEISETVPRRRANRDAERIGLLTQVGSGADLASLGAGKMIVVGDGGAQIGRRPAPPRGTAAVTLADRTVSALHAQITRGADGYLIEDKGSTNGTLVDGRATEGKVLLREGAVLFLGSQVLVFRTGTAADIAAIEADVAAPFAPVPTLSPALGGLCAKLRLLSPSQSELLLLGETGVGKEVFAQAIHAASGRSGRLMAINCAALPRELVESELFGYERGAHSTARTRKQGLIEVADGGTLFLDELGEMPLDVQSKLLRFLQDRTYLPVGSTKAQTADVRILAASSRGSGLGATPAIQEALLGRLGAHPIQIPPLRERVEDLGHLVAFFLRAASAEGRPLEAEAFQALCLYRWPHNVRELQKVITEAELLSRASDTIGFDHLPPAIVDALDRADAAGDPDGDDGGDSDGDDPGPDDRPDGVTPRERSGRVTRVRLRRPVPPADELRVLMRQYQGNVAHVAKHLNRQWAVIWRCLQRYGIDPDAYRPGSGGGAGGGGGGAGPGTGTDGDGGA